MPQPSKFINHKDDNRLVTNPEELEEEKRKEKQQSVEVARKPTQ